MGFDVKRFQFLLSLCYNNIENNIDNDHNSVDDNDSHNIENDIDNNFLYSINYSPFLTQLSSVLFFFYKSLYFFIYQ